MCGGSGFLGSDDDIFLSLGKCTACWEIMWPRDRPTFGIYDKSVVGAQRRCVYGLLWEEMGRSDGGERAM